MAKAGFCNVQEVFQAGSDSSYIQEHLGSKQLFSSFWEHVKFTAFY